MPLGIEAERTLTMLSRSMARSLSDEALVKQHADSGCSSYDAE